MRIEGGAKAEDGRPLEPSFEVGGSMMLYESDSVALSASMSLDVEVSDEESATFLLPERLGKLMSKAL